MRRSSAERPSNKRMLAGASGGASQVISVLGGPVLDHAKEECSEWAES